MVNCKSQFPTQHRAFYTDGFGRYWGWAQIWILGKLSCNSGHLSYLGQFNFAFQMRFQHKDKSGRKANWAWYLIFDILIIQYFQVTRQGLDALSVCLLHEDGDSGLNRCRQGASICMKKNETNFKDVPIETEAHFWNVLVLHGYCTTSFRKTPLLFVFWTKFSRPNGRLSPVACHTYLESLCISGQF